MNFTIITCASILCAMGLGIVYMITKADRETTQSYNDYAKAVIELKKETSEDYRPPVRYEYTTRYVDENPLCAGYRPLEKILNEMAEDGWRVLEMKKNDNSQYRCIYFERPKIKDDAKTQNF